MNTTATTTRVLRAFAVSTALFLAVAHLFAAGKQDFTLVNATSVEIHEVYVSPHNSNDWEEDVLGRDTLPAGANVHITFDRSEAAALWDLKVVDKDGNSIEWENLDLLKISKLTLHYKDGRAWADVE
jgi:hypothetical protein